MNATIQELTQAIIIEQARHAQYRALIELMIAHCSSFRVTVLKNEEKLIKWRSEIEQGLRDDIEEADDFEEESERFRAEVDEYEENMQDLQNEYASID